MAKSIISVSDLNKREISDMINLADILKNDKNLYGDTLSKKIFLLLFEKQSTRTRVSFESAIKQMNGKTIFLSRDESQLSRNERIEDMAKVLGMYVDCVIARVYKHDDLLKFKNFGNIPIINALSDLEHPIQILSDVYSMFEIKKNFDFKLAYVGDCNNITNSLILASKMMGFEISVASPKEYEKEYIKNLNKTGIKNFNFEDIKDAVKGADFVYTDVWTSMGQEVREDENERLKAFEKFRITKKLLNFAKKDVRIMHCMPIHYGMEIEEDVANSKHSIIFAQAENKIYMEKAVLAKIWDF
ncbi:Ornithine carbamoyltransferase [groundwater metagenome]|uniref:Ornithine carbamoyltransferase n=1 Tax=groundwater metagenome TaxID=717931 RepID=A0A098EAP0_9ZZZZ